MINESKSAEDWYKIAVKLVSEREYFEALKCLQRAVEIDKDYAEAWRYRAALLSRLEQHKEAKECVERASKIAPASEKIWYTKAWVLDRAGEHEEAIKCYDHAIKINENYADAWNDKAYVLANINKNVDAIEPIEKALKIIKYDKEHPHYPNYLDTKGFIYYNLGNYKRARELLEEAIDKNSKDPDFWYHKGNVLFKLKDYDAAVKCYDAAISLRENFAEVHDAKAVGLSYKENYEDALKEVRKAIQIKPTLASAHEHLAELVPTSSKGGPNFWGFWNASDPRRFVALLLVLFVLSLIIPPIVFGYETVKIDVKEGAEQTKTITTTKEHKIPETHLILVGLAVLVLLSPEIRKAKIGPGGVELELSGPSLSPRPKLEPRE